MTRSPKSSQAIFEDVKAVVVVTLDIEDQADDLGPETGLYGSLPELNSLTVVKLIVALQKRFEMRSRSTRSSVTSSTPSGASRPSGIQGALGAAPRSRVLQDVKRRVRLVEHARRAAGSPTQAAARPVRRKITPAARGGAP